jgi:hypothetical protein
MLLLYDVQYLQRVSTVSQAWSLIKGNTERLMKL